MDENTTRTKAEKMAEAAKVAFIGSVDEQGRPNVKGMEIRGRKGLVFYFSTASTTARVRHYAANPKAALYLYSGFNGVMLHGRMDILDDNESKRIVWRDGDDFYYPQGFTDPTFKVLRFTPESGRLNDETGARDFGLPLGPFEG